MFFPAYHVAQCYIILMLYFYKPWNRYCNEWYIFVDQVWSKLQILKNVLALFTCITLSVKIDKKGNVLICKSLLTSIYSTSFCKKCSSFIVAVHTLFQKIIIVHTTAWSPCWKHWMSFLMKIVMVYIPIIYIFTLHPISMSKHYMRFLQFHARARVSNKGPVWTPFSTKS